MDAMLAGAVSAAVKFSITNLHAVTDDRTAAVGASRRKCMDRAFEAVEYMPLITDQHGKRFVVIVSTDFTSGHSFFLSLK